MQEIIVAKFGGSSMKDCKAMQRSAEVAVENSGNFILVSATSGTTDSLLELIALSEKDNWSECEKALENLTNKHLLIAEEIGIASKIKDDFKKLFEELATMIKGIHLLKECSPKARDQILSIGERSSSFLFSELFAKAYPAKSVTLFDIRNVLQTTKDFNKARPILDQIKLKTKESIHFEDNTIYISQGFIGRTVDGMTTTLGRGGSDYSAALMAEALDAKILQIWTDVAGIASTDPRICETAQAIDEISYAEASEMAHYGAKVLHPTTLVPAMRNEIPVFVGSSYDSKTKGTWIRKDVAHRPLVRAITKRDQQSLLTISTPKMLDSFGFMSEIFFVFKKHMVSVDCVTTSEISVAISIDESMKSNMELLEDLNAWGEVSFEEGYSLISLIGNKILSTAGVGATLFETLKDVNVRMVCLGASANNFNILVNSSDCNEAIKKLHKAFIGEKSENSITWSR